MVGTGIYIGGAEAVHAYHYIAFIAQLIILGPSLLISRSPTGPSPTRRRTAPPPAHRGHDEVAARQPGRRPRDPGHRGRRRAAALARPRGRRGGGALGRPGAPADVHGLLRPRGLHPDRLRRDARGPRARRRGHGAAELGALRAVQDDRLDLGPAGRAADAGRRPRGRAVDGAVRRGDDAGAGRGPGAARDDRPAERDAARGLRALRAVHALHGHREHHGLARRSRSRSTSARPTTPPRACPLGVQLLGQPAGEGALLALAAQLEAAQPWADRRPPVS